MPTAMTTYPNETWLTQLRTGNQVYLVKEGRFAHVEWPWEPPINEFGTGRIGLRFEGGWRDAWGLRANGRGNDGSQCLMPVEGDLLASPDPLPEPEMRQLQRRLAAVEERSRQQWEQINRLNTGMDNLHQRYLRLRQVLTDAGLIPLSDRVLDELAVAATPTTEGRVPLDVARVRDLMESQSPIRVSIARPGVPPSEASVRQVIGTITAFSTPNRKVADIARVEPERTSRFDRIDEK